MNRQLTEEEKALYESANMRLAREKIEMEEMLSIQLKSLSFLKDVHYPYLKAKAEYESTIAPFNQAQELKQMELSVADIKSRLRMNEQSVALNLKFLTEGVSPKEGKETT